MNFQKVESVMRTARFSRSDRLNVPFGDATVMSFPVISIKARKVSLRTIARVHRDTGDQAGTFINALRRDDRGREISGLWNAIKHSGFGRVPHVTFAVFNGAAIGKKPRHEVVMLQSPNRTAASNLAHHIRCGTC